MKPSIGLATLVATWLIAGCASGPEPATAPVAAASADPDQAAVQASSPTVVNLNEAPQESPDSTVICRHVLRHASNMIDRRCMTVADWRIYEQAEARQAREMLRRMQTGELY